MKIPKGNNKSATVIVVLQTAMLFMRQPLVRNKRNFLQNARKSCYT